MNTRPRSRQSPAQKPTAGKPAASPGKPAPGRQTASGGKPAKNKIPWGVIFWIVFFAAVACLFIYNRENIRETLAAAGSGTVSAREQGPSDPPAGNEAAETSDEISVAEPLEPVPSAAVDESALPDTSSAGDAAAGAEAGNDVPAEALPANGGSGEPAGVTQPEAPAPESRPASVAENPPEASAVEAAPVLRDRAMYFLIVDNDGAILRTKVNRSLPASDSPLTDTLSALLAGPGPDEQRQGLISLIPGGTRIMSAIVRGTTAYINFSEDFQFNTYGVEGYAGALRQVVWTATEFSNVRDVQILIEGRRIDYLGEGVWIGSPVTREMF